MTPLDVEALRDLDELFGIGRLRIHERLHRFRVARSVGSRRHSTWRGHRARVVQQASRPK